MARGDDEIFYGIIEMEIQGTQGIPRMLKEKKEGEPVARRHQMVSISLALLLFISLELPLESRAAAPIGDEVL